MLSKTVSSWLPTLGQLLVPGSASSSCHLQLPNSSLHGGQQPWATGASGPAQGSSRQHRVQADVLRAGRVSPGCPSLLGPLSLPHQDGGKVGVLKAPCRQHSGMCSGRMLTP